MKALARLIEGLSPDPERQVAALVAYLRPLDGPDRVATVALLAGRTPRRLASGPALRRWACAAAEVPDWLFDECLAAAGDLAEALAHVLPAPSGGAPCPGPAAVLARLAGLAGLAPAAREAGVLSLWADMPAEARALVNRLLTGGFRSTVSVATLARALAQLTNHPAEALALRLGGDRDLASLTFDDLIGAEVPPLTPHAFVLPRALAAEVESLGAATDWIAQWWHGGCAVQLVRRAGSWQVWSGPVAPMQVPHLAPLAARLPEGTVIMGELAAPGAAGATGPAGLIAHDLLEMHGTRLDDVPFSRRRNLLAQLCATLPGEALLHPAEAVAAPDWPCLRQLLAQARARGAAGLRLTRRAAQPGEPAVHWAPPPLRLTAVLIHAETAPGAAGLARLTLGLRHGADFVPVAAVPVQALPRAEAAALAAWIRAHATQRFGPVRQVPPAQVFELGFAGASPAPRRKSGLVLLDPVLLGWRQDTGLDQVDTLDTLKALVRGAAP